MDEATRELFEEIAQVRTTVPSDSVTGVITREQWQQRWKKVKEDTSSSQLGLHFGHYIMGAECDYISQFHALRVSLALKKGIVLERWSNGLSIMLEKMFRVHLVSKLRAILLMEADFNAMNKEVYGVRMLDMARKYKLMPEEIFSKKNRTADDEVWQRPCSTTSRGRHDCRQQPPQWTRPTVMIGLRTPWPCSYISPLELRTRPLLPC
jgi:hypothetical protein